MVAVAVEEAEAVVAVVVAVAVVGMGAVAAVCATAERGIETGLLLVPALLLRSGMGRFDLRDEGGDELGGFF